MDENHATDADVRLLLRTVGLESLCQWDVLTFLYRHRTTLMGPPALARLMGYPVERVLAALHHLAALKLLERSRESYHAQIYRFTPSSEPLRNEALARLLELGEDRSGRLLLSRNLLRGDRTPREGLHAARLFLDDARQVVRLAQRRSREVAQILREHSGEPERTRDTKPVEPDGVAWRKAI